MKRKLESIFLIASIVLLWQCKKASNGCQWSAVPDAMFFQIKLKGTVLMGDTLEGIKLAYLKNGNKTYIQDLNLAVDYYANKGILTSRSIGTLGANSYLIEYPNGLETDTLFVDYILPSPSTNCVYILQQVKFNNVIISPDTTFGYQPVYVLNKSK